ncbi:MAG: autotransporter outer membrane beta-barrel domain-containing protein [Polyangiaceae bacterium]
MRATRRVGRRAVTFGAALSAATFAVVTPCFAIETGQPPNLPPPPPPPLTTATPGTTSAPPPSRTTRPASAPPASSSATVTAGGSTADSGATFNGGGALDTRWFIAPLLGFASEDLSLGIGVRGGKTLENHIYIGGTFVFQVGESGSYGATVNAAGTTVSSSGSWSTNGFYVGPEGGYDFDLKAVVLRPYMGLGLFDLTGSGAAGGASWGSSSTHFIIWPGCTVIWNVPSTNYFLGGDARLITIPGTAFGLYAMAGIHFGS